MAALLVRKDQLAALEKVIFVKTYGPRKEADINRSLIGKNAGYILQKAGIACDDTVRLGHRRSGPRSPVALD